MKKTFLVLTMGMTALTAVLLYERLFVERFFGPAAVAALGLLLCVVLAFFVSYLLSETRYRNNVLSTWLVLTSIAVPFFILDLVAGFFLIKPLSPALRPDPNRHHSMVPTSYSRIEQSEFSYIQRVNNLGMRGQDATLAKPANTFRILMLGDSFTMGKGVHDDETWSVLTERALNEKAAACGGPHIQVLNGGVDSYAPILSLIELRELRATTPDVVVEDLDVTDLVQEQAYRHMGSFAADGMPLRVHAVTMTNPSLTDRVRTWIDKHLVFTRFIFVSIDKMFHYGNVDVGTRVITLADPEIVNYTLAGDTVDRRHEWADIFDSIDRMKKLSDTLHAAFVLSIYPWPHQYSDTSWIPGRYEFMAKNARPSENSVKTIESLAAKDSIELFTAFPAFRAYRGNRDLYYKQDMHWTSAGASVMATAMTDYLERRYSAAWCKR